MISGKFIKWSINWISKAIDEYPLNICKYKMLS